MILGYLSDRDLCSGDQGFLTRREGKIKEKEKYRNVFLFLKTCLLRTEFEGL